MQGGGLEEKPNRVASKKVDRNAGGLSNTPMELCKKQFDDPDIGPVLQWKESGTRPFGLEVCATSVEIRHYWNFWDRLQIENGVLMRLFIKHDVIGDHLHFLVPRTMCIEMLQYVNNSLLWGQKRSREKVQWHFIVVEYGEIAIMGLLNATRVLKSRFLLSGQKHPWVRC